MSLVTDHNGHCIMWHNLIDHRGSRELGNTFKVMIITVAVEYWYQLVLLLPVLAFCAMFVNNAAG